MSNEMMKISVESESKLTPLMQQWHTCKQAAGDALLLFRLGDFYEAFYEDAVIAARELELTLTKRQEIPMSGVPYHAAEAYIDCLVSKGYRVAIAEQLEDARQAKGLVQRGITRIVTPGTLINSSLISEKSNNFVACIARAGQMIGLAALDITTAEFRVVELETEVQLLNELCKLQPSEIVTSVKLQDTYQAVLGDLRKTSACLISTHEEWRFEHQTCYDFLIAHFGVKSLDGFGLRGMSAAINAAGALLNYLQDILCLSVGHVNEIKIDQNSHYMAIDKATWRHLELMEAQESSSKKHSLLGLLDQTRTAMGARLMRQWLKQPLLDPEAIRVRQDAVEAFCAHEALLEAFRVLLDQVRDMERLMMKISSGFASPRDLTALKTSFETIPDVKRSLHPVLPYSALIQQEEACLDPLPQMSALIGRALVDDPPLKLKEGKLFREGYCQELDELYEISRDAKSWLLRYQTELKEATGIKTLKVGFNKMFGYFIEVSRGQAEKMPESFQRRQTLVNGERFITQELKEFENKVMHAEERIGGIEAELFAALRCEVAKFGPAVQKTAKALAKLDLLQGLAKTARMHEYVRPLVDNSSLIQIENGRHPIIEAVHATERFIPNDTLMDDSANRLLLITGPNMGGKSTYIRQVALIVLMAQIGSFVPASSAHIGIVDKLFSRIGANDDLSRGQSTFMVEMMETANILNNATSKSLVILDEIGRGTSTYDGISIAWSVAEYLLTAEEKQAKTLFATHYWELTKLENRIPGAVNYHLAVHEGEDKILFLRKIIRGSCDKSYGIHVGRLAGLPLQVIERAKEILLHLEENANRKHAFEPSPAKPAAPKPRNRQLNQKMQLTLFSLD
jgi:DNA mismatch repair protein MutS